MSEDSPLNAQSRPSHSPGVAEPGARPRVGVLVDLALTPTAGGHVRFWHNIAKAAACDGCEFDLTVHFQGEVDECTTLSPHVRIVTLPPVFSTGRIPWLDSNPDHTDLAPYHRRLSEFFETYDIIHTTDAYFAYAKTATKTSTKTATKAAARTGLETAPILVSSIHTDTPAYSRIYAEETFRNFFRSKWLARRAIERWHWPQIAENQMNRSLTRHLEVCRYIWHAPSDAADATHSIASDDSMHILKRGIDRQLFSANRRDRPALESTFGIEPDDFVLAFAGRIDLGKEVMVAAEAARLLLDRGRKIKFFGAGLGQDSDRIRALLGDAAILPGFVEQNDLGWILASSDAFVFPSRIETAANAVIEARACGLPVLTTSHVGNMLIEENGVDGIKIKSQAPNEWADAIETLVNDTAFAKSMGARASTLSERTQPSWHEVLVNDLVPGWRRALRHPSMGR